MFYLVLFLIYLLIVLSFFSEEIKVLEQKLRAAYIAKERQAQMAEKKALQYDRMAEEAEMSRKIQEQIALAEKERALKEAVLARNKIQYNETLRAQLADKENQRKKAYEEFLHDKMMIDEIVRKIYEEDQRF